MLYFFTTERILASVITVFIDDGLKDVVQAAMRRVDSSNDLIEQKPGYLKKYNLFFDFFEKLNVVL